MTEELLAWQYVVMQHMIELSRNDKEQCFSCKNWIKTEQGLILTIWSCSMDELVENEDTPFISTQEFLNWEKLAELARRRGLKLNAIKREKKTRKER